MEFEEKVDDKRYEVDPIEGKTCPLINGHCLREKCLAYKTSVSEWNDTFLEDKPGDVDGVTVVKTTETVTGKRFKGTTFSCNLGVFDRGVKDVMVISSNSHEVELEETRSPSGIILSSQG